MTDSVHTGVEVINHVRILIFKVNHSTVTTWSGWANRGTKLTILTFSQHALSFAGLLHSWYAPRLIQKVYVLFEVVNI
jgi:hypothetical protein